MWYVLYGISKKVVIEGLTVAMVDVGNGGLNVPLRARLALALELIDHYAPRFGARLRRDVKAIIVEPAGGTHFSVRMRVIQLDARWSIHGRIEDLALTLVHEATHARCRSLGVGYRGKERRSEALCLRAEAAFADLLEADQVPRPSLDALDKPWWTVEENERRFVDAMKVLGQSEALTQVLARRLRKRALRGGQ